MHGLQAARPVTASSMLAGDTRLIDVYQLPPACNLTVLCMQVMCLRTGQQLATLQGHMESVNACAYSAGPQELYTGANDSQVLAWAPQELIVDDEDTWSD